MKDKLKHFALENTGLKVTALIVAVLMWLLVNNYANPIAALTYSNIAVRLVNTNVITDENEVYVVLDGSDTVSQVTISAPRSVIDAISSDNITATADFRNITAENTVPIRFSTNKYYNEVESIRGSSDQVKLLVEERTRKVMFLRCQTSGDPAEGYVVGDVTPDQNQIRLSGPESVINSISYAMATVDVTGASGTITTNVDVRLYDAEDNVVDTSYLTMNINTVKTTVNVLPTKSVALMTQVGGTPAPGFVRDGLVTVSPETVLIAGKPAVLGDVERIVIGADEGDVSGAENTVTVTANVREYLPDGIILADKEWDASALVTVGVVPVQYRDLTVEAEDITFTGLPEGYVVRMDGDSEITVRISGLAANVDAVRAEELHPVADLSILTAADGEDITGSYNLPLQVTLPDGITAEESFIRIEVSLIPEE